MNDLQNLSLKHVINYQVNEKQEFCLFILNDDFNDVIPIAYNRRCENLFAIKKERELKTCNR